MIETDRAITAEIELYYDLFRPEADGRRPLLVAVHGYGAHKRYMMREAQLIAPKDFVIASIQGPHQHYRKTDTGYKVGFGWLTDHRSAEYVALHHRFILDLVERLTDEGAIDTEQIHLFGFSQACAINFRFAFTHGEMLKSVMGVCGGIPGDLDSNEAYEPFDAKTLYLYGDDDEFYTQEQFKNFDARLGTMLPNYRSRQYAAKHEITDDMRSDMREFLAAIV